MSGLTEGIFAVIPKAAGWTVFPISFFPFVFDKLFGKTSKISFPPSVSGVEDVVEQRIAFLVGMGTHITINHHDRIIVTRRIMENIIILDMPDIFPSLGRRNR